MCRFVKEFMHGLIIYPNTSHKSYDLSTLLIAHGNQFNQKPWHKKLHKKSISPSW